MEGEKIEKPSVQCMTVSFVLLIINIRYKEINKVKMFL